MGTWMYSLGIITLPGMKMMVLRVSHPIPSQLRQLHLSMRLIWTVMGIWMWWGHPPVVLGGMRMMVLGVSPPIKSAIIIIIAGSDLSMHWMWMVTGIWMW